MIRSDGNAEYIAGHEHRIALRLHLHQAWRDHRRYTSGCSVRLYPLLDGRRGFDDGRIRVELKLRQAMQDSGTQSDLFNERLAAKIAAAEQIGVGRRLGLDNRIGQSPLRLDGLVTGMGDRTLDAHDRRRLRPAQ